MVVPFPYSNNEPPEKARRELINYFLFSMKKYLHKFNKFNKYFFYHKFIIILFFLENSIYVNNL